MLPVMTVNQASTRRMLVKPQTRTFSTSHASPTAVAARTKGVGLTATAFATKAGRVTPVSTVRRVDMETIAACRAIVSQSGTAGAGVATLSASMAWARASSEPGPWRHNLEEEEEEVLLTAYNE